MTAFIASNWGYLTMKKVIVLGNDHTNSLGVVQTLGESGYDVYPFVWGEKTGLLASSIFSKKVYGCHSIEDCINQMIQTFDTYEKKIPIIACCDSAALALEKNKKRLSEHFVFEESTIYSLEYLFKKENQVQLAKEAGFDTPKTWNLLDSKKIPKDVLFPCLIKPLVSCEGAKSDIRICNSLEQLKYNLNNLLHTSYVLLQQYIEKDYEVSILGCSCRNGDVIIPCVENKLSIYPKDVGLVCVADMQPLQNEHIIQCIKNIIKNIGYVGVFSVEMMHCKHDKKFYFTEINLRNDGANSFVYKYGVNLPLNHIEDLLDEKRTIFNEFHPGYYVWEMHHFLSLVHREITVRQWISDLKKSNGFLTFFPNDRKPFFKQYENWILSKFHLKANEQY